MRKSEVFFIIVGAILVGAFLLWVGTYITQLHAFVISYLGRWEYVAVLLVLVLGSIFLRKK